MSRAFVSGFSLLVGCTQSAVAAGQDDTPAGALTPDPVIARVYEHWSDRPRPIVVTVDSRRLPAAVWKRVKHLVAFRLHRPQPDGRTIADAPIYLLRDGHLYRRAVDALRYRTTNDEYVWCLLAAVLAHEAAHVAPMTERQALTAEAGQLRQCLAAGHLVARDGWSPLAYLRKVEAKLERPHEHY